MPAARLTDKSIDRLPLTIKGYVEYYDTKLTGFGVRCGPKFKVYFVASRVKGRKNETGHPLKIKLNLGRVEILQFDDAYSQALVILGDAAKGITPDDHEKEQDRQQVLEQARDLTVKQILEEYCQTKKKLKQTTKDSYLETLTRYVKDWLKLPIREITPDMVVRRHTEAGQKSPANADYTMRIIRALCNHTIETYEDVMVKNPVKRLSTLNAWYKVRRKSSYITPSDLQLWLPAMLERSPDARDYYLGLLFTGARYDELISIKWKDINLQEGTAMFRETKSGAPLLVPLCGYYLDMLKVRKEIHGGKPDDYMFPSDQNPTGHLVDLKEHLRAVKEATGISSTQHDLRRCFLSYADEVGISPYAIKRLCNHALPQDVTEGYLQFNMDRLRRDVEKIASFILSHAGLKVKGKVIQLSKAA